MKETGYYLNINKNRKMSGVALISLIIIIFIVIILSVIIINLMSKGEVKENSIGLITNETYLEDNIVDEVFLQATKSIQKTTTTVKDNNGNKIVIPGGFKISKESGVTIEEGIVIEDDSGNQFVWIPVSNLKNDGSNLIIKDNGTKVEITLGRYTFNETTGKETLIQPASNYKQIVTLEQYYQELPQFRESNQIFDSTGTNSTAKDLAGFIKSVEQNKGYYIARYEASYASGKIYGIGTSSNYYKPYSKKSKFNSMSSMSYVEGTLWNKITQGDASKISRNMYYDDEYVESDLINSYAWNTAIVYIQEMGNTNYASKFDGNGELKNTGETGDVVCKIYDMSSNLLEWTTEYSTYKWDGKAIPCVYRGGNYYKTQFNTAHAFNVFATEKSVGVGFRPIVYIK